MSYFNPLETIYRQFVASPNMRRLIFLMGQEVEPRTFIDQFYDNVWNINTANTYGLNIWGKILNLSRVMTYQTAEHWFGFSEALLSYETANDPTPFDNASFYNDGEDRGGSVVLPDAYYRKALMMKAMANITDCTAPSLNRMLMYVFGDSGEAWVEHDGPMQMSYHFAFTPTSVELALIQNSDILPQPAGCRIAYILEGHSNG
ncbi:hypothetical protein LMG33818_000065 [Halomonadaceae bacterium LMG 33818]|uniref:DUF2612 domain-containing protein n=1 Tax=Cernens ardua TaxID=3402176 RepID=UPI003EDC83E2